MASLGCTARKRSELSDVAVGVVVGVVELWVGRGSCYDGLTPIGRTINLIGIIAGTELLGNN